MEKTIEEIVKEVIRKECVKEALEILSLVCESEIDEFVKYYKEDMFNICCTHLDWLKYNLVKENKIEKEGFFGMPFLDEEYQKLKNMKKYLIISHKRWGKDTLAEILNKHFGMKFASSSQTAADIFIYDALKEKYGYNNPLECFEDRINHRAEWYNLIKDYNKDDRARLAKEILNYTNCYVGMRDREEIDECVKQGLFDLIIWVDASKRLEEEDKSSFNIDKSYADVVIDNNGTLDEFKERVIRLGNVLFK